ncbi:MAG: LptF/LptG family permease [Holosporales bacterium]|jgi:lipopolysaccharide export system permease protein|nr:LptF/LptG family permease [Holosporales bacterium]
MMVILSRYIKKVYMRCFCVVILCFFFIISILEIMEVIRKYFSNSINISHLVITELAVRHTVVSTFSFFPTVILLSTIMFFIIMHGKLELTVMKVSGITSLGIIRSLLAIVALLGVFYISVLDEFSASSVKKIAYLEMRLKQNSRGTDKSMTLTNKGIWFRDSYEGKSYIIYAKLFDLKVSALRNIGVFQFSKNHELQSTTYARTASIYGGKWHFLEARKIDMDGNKSFAPIEEIPTNLTLSDIQQMVANPNSISFWSIKKYASMLESVGLSSIKHVVTWFVRLSSILQMFAFVLLTTAFCQNYNPRNNKRYSLKIAVLIAASFPIYFFNNILIAYGESEQIPISIAAFVVPCLIALGSCLILAKR